jgi:D-glycero-D-manno-heptose 1,7-bisphosphate phosphatase
VRRAVFLDRDGVLNEARVVDGRPLPPERPQDAVPLPGVVDACRRLADAGWLLVVVTNQPDIARGTCTRAQVDAINQIVTADLPIAEIVVCPHDDVDDCGCRKPRPGMLVDAAARWGIDLGSSAMVGDRWRDVEAGRRAGTRTILVGRAYGEASCEPDHVVSTLAEAADLLLDRTVTS